jgi:hypothetical protein
MALDALKVIPKKEMYVLDVMPAYGSALILVGMAVLKDLTQRINLLYVWRRSETGTVQISDILPASLTHMGNHYIVMNQGYDHLFPPKGELWEMMFHIVNKHPRLQTDKESLEAVERALGPEGAPPQPAVGNSDFAEAEHRRLYPEFYPHPLFQACETSRWSSAKPNMSNTPKTEEAMKDRQVLENLVKIGNRFRRTPIVDDDFPGMRNEFDSALTAATTYLSVNPVPTEPNLPPSMHKSVL